MRILNRYLLKEVFPSFLISLGFIVFLFFMGEIFYLTEIFITRNVPLSIVFQVLFYLLPSILALALPLAFIAGVLGGLARLSSDREMDALKVLGISPQKLAGPIFLLGVFCWLISLGFTLWLSPAANYRWLQLMVNSVLNRINLVVEPGRFVESLPGKVILVERRAEDGHWERVFLYQEKEKESEKREIVLADSGQLMIEPGKKEARILLVNGKNYEFDPQRPEDLIQNEFQKLEQNIDLSQLAGNFSLEKKSREKNIKELWADWQRIRKNPAPDFKEKRMTLVEIHKRFSLPAACLIFVFLGVGLGWKRWPGGRISGYALSLIILIGYYFLFISGEQNALRGKQPVWLAMWLPDILLLIAGLYFYFSAQGKKINWLKIKLDGVKDKLQKRLIDFLTEERSTFLLRKKSHSLFFPSLIDRYLLSRFLHISSLIFSGLLSILVLINFIQRLELLKETQKPVHLLLLFLWYKLPEFILLTLLATALISSALSLTYLRRQNEVLAFLTSGISYFRLVALLLLLAILLSPLIYFFQDRVVSRSNFRAEEIWNEVSDQPIRKFTYLHHYWLRGEDLKTFYHYDFLDLTRKEISRLLVLEIAPEHFRLKKIIYAQQALIEKEGLKLKDCWEREFEQEMSRFSRKETAEVKIEKPEKYFLREWKEPSVMTVAELAHYAGELERSGSPATRFRLEAEFRKAFSFSFLVMVLWSVAAVGLAGQKGFIFPLGMSLLSGFIFWQTMAIFRSLGMSGVLSPFMASWGPLFIFLLAGFYLLLKSRT